MRAEAILIGSTLWPESHLAVNSLPIATITAGPLLTVHRYLIGISGIRLKTRHPAVVGGFSKCRSDHVTFQVHNLNCRFPIWFGRCADGLAPRWMYVIEVVIVDQLEVSFAFSHAKVKRSPGNQHRFVSQTREI